jgi:hypothetical protein
MEPDVLKLTPLLWKSTWVSKRSISYEYKQEIFEETREVKKWKM